MSKQNLSASVLRFRIPLISALVGLFAMFAEIILMAFAAVKLCLSTSMFPAFSTLCLCTGCFFTSVSAARLRGRSGVFCGLISALAYILMIAFLGAVSGELASAGNFVRMVSMLPCGCIGGFLGILQSEKKKARRARS